MSRAKVRGFIKQPIATIVVSPEKRVSERKVVLNPETNEYEVQFIETATPEIVKQGKAFGPTTKGGKRNTPESMAPKGKGGAAPITRSKK